MGDRYMHHASIVKNSSRNILQYEHATFSILLQNHIQITIFKVWFSEVVLYLTLLTPGKVENVHYGVP